MTDEEFEQRLSKIEKKQDKMLTILTKMAKALHLLPVSEKEEREIQLLQRKSAATIHKVQDEIAALETPDTQDNRALSYSDLLNASEADVYNDIIGDDYISKEG